jgi:hypothetical protein
MLAQDARIPSARVWITPGEEGVELRDAIAGEGLVLLCFYVFDWSAG